MTETERIVRTFHESWDLGDPERGAKVIAHDCRFEDVARGELQIGPDGYTRDYERWRSAFPDGEVKIVNVVVTEIGQLSSSSTAAPTPDLFNPVWARSLHRVVRWKSATAV